MWTDDRTLTQLIDALACHGVSTCWAKELRHAASYIPEDDLVVLNAAADQEALMAAVREVLDDLWSEVAVEA